MRSSSAMLTMVALAMTIIQAMVSRKKGQYRRGYSTFVHDMRASRLPPGRHPDDLLTPRLPVAQLHGTPACLIHGGLTATWSLAIGRSTKNAVITTHARAN